MFYQYTKFDFVHFVHKCKSSATFTTVALLFMVWLTWKSNTCHLKVSSFEKRSGFDITKTICGLDPRLIERCVSKQKVVLARCSYVKTRILGSTNFHHTCFTMKYPFDCCVDNIWCWSDFVYFATKRWWWPSLKNTINKFFENWNICFAPLIVYGIYLEFFPKISLTIPTTYIYFVEIDCVFFQKKWCFDFWIFDNNF